MKIGNIELTQENIIAGALIVVAAILLGLYVFIYAPLLKDIRQFYRETKALESTLQETHDSIDRLNKSEHKKDIVSEENVSSVITEMTQLGEKRDINFISMKPQKPELIKNSSYKVLPVKISMEGSYENIAKFLGSLDDIQATPITVQSIDMVRSDEMGILSADIGINIYMLGGNDAK